MDFPINTSAQLRAVLRGLRKARGLSQADTGARIGVNQKRIARIEAAPGVTSFDQIARVVSALGGRLVIQDLTEKTDAKSGGKAKQKGDW
jgi:HTH-type transcriptional regulator / antitoxin HipB